MSKVNNFVTEYFYSNQCSVAIIMNNIAAVRTMFIVYFLPTDPFRAEQIKLYVKSLKINRPLLVRNLQIVFSLHSVKNHLGLCTF